MFENFSKIRLPLEKILDPPPGNEKYASKLFELMVTDLISLPIFPAVQKNKLRITFILVAIHFTSCRLWALLSRWRQRSHIHQEIINRTSTILIIDGQKPPVLQFCISISLKKEMELFLQCNDYI